VAGVREGGAGRVMRVGEEDWRERSKRQVGRGAGGSRGGGAKS